MIHEQHDKKLMHAIFNTINSFSKNFYVTIDNNKIKYLFHFKFEGVRKLFLKYNVALFLLFFLSQKKKKKTV